MALELVKLDSTTLPGIADAIRAKTGETALLLPSQMAAAIGGIKNLRVETGTITPAEDCASLTVEITGFPKSVSVVAAQSHTPAQGDILGACYDVLPWRTVCGYNGAILYYANGSSRLTQVNASVDAASIGFPAVSSSFHWLAGVEYTWTAYYWEDDI